MLTACRACARPILIGLNPERAQAILAQAGLGERSGLRLFLP
jgi:hypothetical protein